MTTIGWQRAEGALVAIAALAIAVQVTPVGWPIWAWPLAILLPDLSMLGYLAGPRRGAAIYNVGHLYGCALALAVIGLGLGQLAVLFVGMLWLAHIGIDRALGYGLKSPEGFHVTHLGRIGRDKG